MRWFGEDDSLGLLTPLTKSYPKGTTVVPWNFPEETELEGTYVASLIAIGAAGRDPALVDEVLHISSDILEKESVFFADGSFRNEPGSYGQGAYAYVEQLLAMEYLFGPQAMDVISPGTKDRIHRWLIHICEFAFSNGNVPHLNGGGCWNQLGRASFNDSDLMQLLQKLFPEDHANIDLYTKVFNQERIRVPGDVIDNVSFAVEGWGYAMLRSEKGSWDRRMETLLSSKHLLSNPGDHVSSDGLGIVVYGLGTILTPRYGYSWIAYLPPFLNQVMVDDSWENGYYGAFWHFDSRDDLPCAVAHTGDGIDSSKSPIERSRWDIQFPEYLFDAYFIDANDGTSHQYDWCFINMGDLEIVEPTGLSWQAYDTFLAGYWPSGGGAGERTIASKTAGRIVADWRLSNAPWVPNGDKTVLRYPPAHGGRLRAIMADDSPGYLINAQIGYYRDPSTEQTQANSEDIVVLRKNALFHAFVDTLEPIADDEEAYVRDVAVVEGGRHLQRLVKVTTADGEDWVYLSGRWTDRSGGDHPVASVQTDADIAVWRVKGGVVTRVYLANGSYATTPHGHWQFESVGNNYLGD
jgi:hypothetical protein